MKNLDNDNRLFRLKGARLSRCVFGRELVVAHFHPANPRRTPGP